MCFGKHTKKRNDRVEKGMDSVYGKDNNPIRKIKKKLRCIQTCGIVWLFLAILLIAIGGTLLYFFISYMNTTGDWHIYLTYSGIAAVSLGGLMFILGIITLICFCHLVKKNQKKLSGKPTKQKKGASLQKQYPVGTYPAQKDFGGEDQSKPAGHLPPIDPDEMKKGKDGKKKKKKKKKKVDPELGYEVNADTEAMIKPEHHGNVHSGRMDLLNEGIEEAIEPERSHVAHSVPGGSGIYEEPDVVVQTHRGEVHAAPIGFGEDAVADGMSYAQKEAAAHAARERHLESQSKQRERDAYDRQQALEHEWQDYEAGKDGRHSNQGRPIIPPLKSARGPELSNGYAGRHDPGEEHVYAEVERGVHAAAPEMEGGVQTAKQRRSPPHYGKHSRVGPAPDQPMAMHIGPTKSTHHTSQDVNGADVPTQPIIQHPPQYLPFGYTPMMSGGQTPGQPEMPYKIFMVAPASTGQPMMMPYPYYMPQTMPMAPPMMMAQMYDPRFMPPQGMTVQPPNYQQQPTHTHSTLGRLDSEEDVLPTMQETVHSAPTIQLHSAPPPGNHLKQTDKQYKELDQDALRALEEFQRIHDSAPKHGQISYASSISEEALEETRENVVESAIDMEEMLQKLEEMYAPTPQKQTTIDMLELEKLVASTQSQNESVDPVVLGDPSDVEEVMEQTHEEQIESAIDIDAMLQKLEEMDAEKGHTVGHDVGSGDEKKKKKKSSYEEDDDSEGGKKKKKKKKKKEGSDDFDSDMESESKKKKKKKKKKNSKKGDEGEESEDEKAKKKKKKKKGSEEDDDFNSEGESDSKKKKKSKNQKDGKKKKDKNKKEHGEEVIAAANVAVVESGVDMDAFLGSDKNTRNSEEPFHIQLHGKPNASERAMAAKLEGLERRVHFVEDSVHIESDDELISTSRSQKNEHAPAPFYEGEEDSVAMDIVQRTESAPVEHPPPSFVNSWNEPARHDLTSDDDDIIIPVKTQHRVRPAVKPRVRIQKNVEVEAYVKPERSAMIETTPSGHSELQLDDVDGFEGDEVITVQRTSQVESAPDIFAMTAPSADVPEIVVSEVDSLDDQDVIRAERTQQIESSPFDEEITQNIITETEAAPIVFEMHERRGLDLHKEDKRKSKMVEGEEEVVVMESVSAIETVPFVLDEKKKSKKDEDKHDKKKKKTKDSDDDDRYKHSNSKDDKKKKKKSEKSDVDEESGDGKTKKRDKKKKKKDSEENSEVDSGVEDEKKKKKKKDKVEEDFGKEKASKKKKKKGSDEEGESDSAEDVKKKKISKSKWENGDEDSGDEKVKKKKKKKDSADEDDSEGDGKKKPKNDKDKKKKKDKKGKEEAIAALSLHSEVNQESKMADGVDDVIVMETAPAIEAAPIALEAALNPEDEKAKKEKKEKTKKKKKKKGGEVEDEGFGMLAPLNARFAPRPLDGGTSPEPKETSPVEAKMEESVIDEVVTVETANVVQATLDAQLEIDAPVATEADLAPVTYLEPQNPEQGQETPTANSGLYGVIPASALLKESSQHEDFIIEEIDVPTNVSLVETSRDISDLLPSAGDSGNQKLEPELKMAASATLKSGYVDDVMDIRKEPMVESSPPMAERSVGIFDLKSAAENEPGLGKTDVPEATSTVVEEVPQIERAPQVESSVDIFDLNRDEIGGTSIVVNEKEATKDVVEDALVVESVPQVHRSVDMFDDDIGKPPIGRNTKEPMATTKLDKNVDILIIGDHDEKDLILADTSEIPEKAKIEVISDVVPVTSEMGTRDGADDTIKLRGGNVGFSTKEESLLLKDRQSPPQEIGKLESALPGGDLDNDSLDDFFGNSDVTQLLGGDESAEKGKEKATSDPLLPPPRFGATRTQHSTHVSNGDANNNMAAQQTVSPPRGDQLNDSMNNFLASDRQASKRDSLDDGGFWDKHETTPRRLGRRNRPVDIMEHPHRDENANKAPSVDIAKHDSANNLKPKALPNASEDNDSVDGVVMWEGDKVELLQTMKRPKDSDFNTTAFVSRNVSDGVTTVTPFKLDSDSEEDILSPMMRKNKKTFITQSKS